VQHPIRRRVFDGSKSVRYQGDNESKSRRRVAGYSFDDNTHTRLLDCSWDPENP
jgi:hypothetical protein